MVDRDIRNRHEREKATIDHLAGRVFEKKLVEGQLKKPKTENGVSIEDQIHKEWDPNRAGGLPIF
jgi:hypothetical protein